MISGIAALIGAVTGLVIAPNKAGVLGSDNAASTLSTTQTGGTTTDGSTSLFGPKTLGGGGGRVWVENGTLYIDARERQHGVRVLAESGESAPGRLAELVGEVGQRGARLELLGPLHRERSDRAQSEGER